MSNIYAAPHTHFSDSNISAATRLFALNGRIGRVRWIAYSTALWMLASVVLGLLLQLAAFVSTDFMFLAGTVLTFSIWLVPLLVARRRLQDLGLGALYLIGVIIPFINLYFIFIMLFKRGDEGSNEFGPPPAPNNRGVYVLAFILPAIMVIGILAAIALPAYMKYTDKARANAPSVSAQADHRQA
ncbi:DUF805 domain-containing protein [Massilia atriviolacea]|uniref:DUF805 domain-containing protein n=1 Tax=Massilia atriviolacea TaxID=2495579 RepID=UPI0013DFA9B1|nr:DUF805 domain-containing protein [Massilia atriviolacea]